MAENFVLGMNCKAYYKAALTAAPDASGWTEIDNVKDVTVNLETGEADITTRANTGWRATAATLKDGSLEFQMLWKPGDAAFEAVRNAWLNSAEIAFMVLDGPVGESDREGPAGNFTVTNFTRNEPLEEAVTVDVTLKPSSYTTWFVVP